MSLAKNVLVALTVGTLFASPLWGHGNEKHAPKNIGESGQDQHSQSINTPQSEEAQAESAHQDFEKKENLPAQAKEGSGGSKNEVKVSSQGNQQADQQDEATAPFSVWVGLEDFPTLHPAVVHFPVVLLPFALLLFLMEWWSRPEKPSLAALISAMGGTAGAMVASFWLHPHVDSLSREVRAVLDAHDFFAYTTTGLATGASICLGIRYFRWNRHHRKWWTLLAFILLVASSLSVTATGHLGATLSHVHKGKIDTGE